MRLSPLLPSRPFLAHWTFSTVSIFSVVGTIAFPDNVAFGIFPHIIGFTILFLLLLIGSSSLTALTDKVSCGNVDWSRCKVTKGLVAIGCVRSFFSFLPDTSTPSYSTY